MEGGKYEVFRYEVVYAGKLRGYVWAETADEARVKGQHRFEETGESWSQGLLEVRTLRGTAVDLEAEWLNWMQYDTQQDKLSDADAFVIWRMGLAAFKQVRQFDGIFPHDPEYRQEK